MRQQTRYYEVMSIWEYHTIVLTTLSRSDRHLLEIYSSSIETFQRVNLKQDIFNYCLCTKELFELEKFLEVLRSCGVHIKVRFSFEVILQTFFIFFFY